MVVAAPGSIPAPRSAQPAIFAGQAPATHAFTGGAPCRVCIISRRTVLAALVFSVVWLTGVAYFVGFDACGNCRPVPQVQGNAADPGASLTKR